MYLPRRKSHRLKDYDYGSFGYYYVTICTKNRVNILAKATENVGSDALVAPKYSITPTLLGKRVIECWKRIAELNENVEIDKFVLMPNHIHGIIIIKNNDLIKTDEKKYSFDIAERRGRRSLQGLIKDFKSVTTRIYKNMFLKDESLWQASFYDEIIRNQNHLNSVLKYIEENPLKWELDELFKNELC